MSHNFNCQTTQQYIKDKKRAELVVTYSIVGEKSYQMEYHIYVNGVVKINSKFIGTKGTDQIDVPRIGQRFRLPVDFKVVEFFGRGPEENYWDRQNASHISRYSSLAEDLYYPYVKPQENGHHVGVRWLAFETDSGKGLLFVANANNENEDVFEFNALRNSVEDFDDEDQKDLQRQWNNFEDCFHRPEKTCIHDEEGAVNRLRRQHHINHIVFRDYVEVNIDFKMMGIAGFDSWGDMPLPEYTLPSNKDYSYSFTAIPINSNNEIDEQIKYAYE